LLGMLKFLRELYGCFEIEWLFIRKQRKKNIEIKETWWCKNHQVFFIFLIYSPFESTNFIILQPFETFFSIFNFK
jgi:hypothetical protein